MPLQIPPFVHEVFVDQAVTSIAVGSGIGFSALVASGVAARSAVSATTTGVQCFLLGTSTFYLRHAFLVGSQQPRTIRLELGCSGVAGACSGALSGALNRGSVFRPALLAGTCGIIAQAAVHTFDYARSMPSEDMSFTDYIAKVLPLKRLSDSQYEGMLQEKLGRINVEIAMLDDQIASLKRQEAGAPSRSRT